MNHPECIWGDSFVFKVLEWLSFENKRIKALVCIPCMVKKYVYDIWGYTANTAARMEQSGGPRKISISGATWALVKNDFPGFCRGKAVAKNKGKVDMYFVGCLDQINIRGASQNTSG